MAKVRDYAKLAHDIKDVIGEENITSAAHCATRLRLVLKESPSAETTAQISSMPGVIQVMEKGGQYQIVIGTHAQDVYEEMAKLLHLDASQQPEVKQGLLNRVIATMSAVFAPFVYILAAAGLVQGCLIIATTFAPAFADTGTYAVLSFISWTPFTFLPVLIAITASKHFNCNTFIAVWCCLALVNPDWTSMAARIAGGESIQFIIFNMAETTYTSTVLPPLFLVLVLSYLERFLNKVVPDIIKALAVPLICAVIAQAAACFGVFLKSRSKDTKNVALSAGLTGIFGITEPAIYGVTLRLKKPFVAGCIGGAAGALVVALTGAKYYIYAGLPGLLTTVNTINASDPGSFTGEMIAVAVTIVVTIIMVQIIGCDEPGEKKSNT